MKTNRERVQVKCADCATEDLFLLDYMLRREAWNQIAGRDRFLCLLCAQARLQRRLEPEDFTGAACNIFVMWRLRWHDDPKRAPLIRHAFVRVRRDAFDLFDRLRKGDSDETV